MLQYCVSDALQHDNISELSGSDDEYSDEEMGVGEVWVKWTGVVKWTPP